jgi:hypothetical protein
LASRLMIRLLSIRLHSSSKTMTKIISLFDPFKIKYIISIPLYIYIYIYVVRIMSDYENINIK